MLKQKPIDALKAAGKHPGLDIWVLREIPPPKRPISLFKTPPIPPKEYELFTVPPAKHGVFHQTDLYIVLKTKENNEKTIHFWIGSAYNDKPPDWLDRFEDLDLGWTAYQHFEFQGYECELFESYFHGIQPAIRYKRGRHPDPYAERDRGETRFYQLKNLDKFYYRVCEVPFSIALMTKEENFILDSGNNIRTYVSNKTTQDELNKCILVTTKIRELDHEGNNGQVEIVDLTSFDDEGDKVSNARAEKLRQEIKNPPEIDFEKPDEDPLSPKIQLHRMTLVCGDDPDVGFPPRCRYHPIPKKVVKEKESFYQRVKKSIAHIVDVILGQVPPEVIQYEIPMVDDKFVRGDMKKPYMRSDLDSKKLYILQGAHGKGVMIWVGKEAKQDSKAELTECLRKEVERCFPAVEEPENSRKCESVEAAHLKQYRKKTPQWTHAIKVIDGHEPLKFKRYFKDWE